MKIPLPNGKARNLALGVIPQCMVLEPPKGCQQPCTPMIAMAGLAAGLIVSLIAGTDLVIQAAIVAGLSGVGVTTAAKQSNTPNKE